MFLTPTRASHPPFASEPLCRNGHALGPLVRFVKVERAVTGRLYALGVAAAATAVLLVAWRVDPGQAAMGTHRQLGLPACGFLTMTGLPCPTCGMTTAFAHTVRGHIPQAVRSQPGGFVLALATLVAGAAGLATLISGYRPGVNWYRVNPVSVVWWAAAGFVLAWALKLVMGLLGGSLPAHGAS